MFRYVFELINQGRTADVFSFSYLLYCTVTAFFIVSTGFFLQLVIYGVARFRRERKINRYRRLYSGMSFSQRLRTRLRRWLPQF